MQADDKPSADTPPALATRREWLALAVISLPCIVYAMDLTVLNLAIPAISRELKPSASQLLWMIDIYGFMVAGFLITMGTLGDRIGRRKLLLWGAAGFALASIVAAFAQTAGQLIAARALLGVAGATLAPSTLSLIRNLFHDERQRQQAIGVWISSFSVGGAIGPLVGGVLIEYFHWSAVFWAAVPVMVLVLILGPRLLPEYRDAAAGKIDLWSVGLSLWAVLAVVYGLKLALEQGVGWAAGAAVAAGLMGAVVFWRRQRGLAYPLLDLSLFANRRFSVALTVYALSCMAMFGVYIFIAQYLQGVAGLSPLLAGLATLPWALSFIVGSMLTTRLTARFSAMQVFTGGLLLAAAGYAMQGAALGGWGWLAISIGSFWVGLGMAPVFTLGNDIIVSSAPPERAGAASALSETVAELAGALGIAFLGSGGLWFYRQTVLDRWPSGVDPAQMSQAGASLEGALDIALALPQVQAEALTAIATAAFAQATLWLLAVGCLASVFAAGVAWRRLR